MVTPPAAGAAAAGIPHYAGNPASPPARLRRPARRAGRHYHGTGDFEGIADACGDQYSGNHFLRGLLHGDRYRIRTAAVGKSSEPESDRCAAERVDLHYHPSGGILWKKRTIWRIF